MAVERRDTGVDDAVGCNAVDLRGAGCETADGVGQHGDFADELPLLRAPTRRRPCPGRKDGLLSTDDLNRRRQLYLSTLAASLSPPRRSCSPPSPTSRCCDTLRTSPRRRLAAVPETAPPASRQESALRVASLRPTSFNSASRRASFQAHPSASCARVSVIRDDDPHAIGGLICRISNK